MQPYVSLLLWPWFFGLAANDSGLEKPVRLEIDGKPIDTGHLNGHAGPLFADFDQRGVSDLLVGSFRGAILVYRNGAKDGAPQLEAAGELEADGEPIRVSNW